MLLRFAMARELHRTSPMISAMHITCVFDFLFVAISFVTF